MSAATLRNRVALQRMLAAELDQEQTAGLEVWLDRADECLDLDRLTEAAAACDEADRLLAILDGMAEPDERERMRQIRQDWNDAAGSE